MPRREPVAGDRLLPGVYPRSPVGDRPFSIGLRAPETGHPALLKPGHSHFAATHKQVALTQSTLRSNLPILLRRNALVPREAHAERPGTQDYAPLDEILQFANVPRPLVGTERSHGFRRNVFDLLTHPAAIQLDKMCDQRRISSQRARNGGSRMGKTFSR